MRLLEYVAGNPTAAVGGIGHYRDDVPSFGKQNEGGTAQDLSLIDPDEDADWSPTYGPHESKESPQTAAMQVAEEGIESEV
jgi:hypothetical protein